MRCDAPVRNRVLDSLERKKRVVMSNSYSRQGENVREIHLSWIDSQKKKILARTPKNINKQERI